MKTAFPLAMILVVLLLRVNTVIAGKIGDNYSKIMKIKDKRFGLTEDVITGIKSIKYLGWEDIFFDKIMDLRKDEFDCIKRIKYLDMYCVMLWGFTSTVIIAVTFMIYNSLGYELEETNIFSVDFHLSFNARMSHIFKCSCSLSAPCHG
jgi:ABC transporter transmembrane region